MALYEIQTLRRGQWTNDGLGDNGLLDSLAEAERAIASLRALGDEWRSAAYRVVAHSGHDAGRVVVTVGADDPINEGGDCGDCGEGVTRLLGGLCADCS